MKKNIIKVALVALGCLFCVSTVYAASNTYQSFMMWANQQKNEAEQQVKTHLYQNVEEQMFLLNEKTNKLLNESTNEITAMSNQEIQETTASINNTLDNHKANLNTVSKEIKTNSPNDFSKITEKVNNHTTELVNSIETDYQTDLGELSSNRLDADEVSKNKEKSNKKLEKEIEKTISTIKKLEKLKSAESNAHVIDYIQRKINFLNELILLLNDNNVNQDQNNNI